VTVRNLLAFHPAVRYLHLRRLQGLHQRPATADIEVYSLHLRQRGGALWPGSTPTNSNIASSRTEALDLDDTDMVTVGGTWTSRFLGIKNQKRRCARRN
jgi:hypothetical protein